MWKVTLKFVLYMLVSSFIIFILVEQTSGNPAILYLQRHGYTTITQQHIDQAQHHLGLSRNIFLRYIDWVYHALTLDLGYSFITHERVMLLISHAISATLKLIIWSTVILLPLGYSIGYLTGIYAHRRWAYFVKGISQFITSMPEYWLAILAIYYFGVKWHVLPFVGSNSWQHFILPVIVIVLVDGCHIILLVAHLVSKTVDSDAYQLACLRNYHLRDRLYTQFKEIFAPIMTISVNTIIQLFGKIVILEVIFSMSGVGKLLINAINQRDYPLIQGILVIIIVTIMLINYLGDLAILKNDPKLSCQQRHM
ncbi:ABC transporter permease [Staphylococcus simiae]|uniref:ABC transporter permease n=1 Tax=Staphylococcus simiae TaxID=308354 RepID=UPI001A978418|nr:ABC transporter permease [Staphylococcus simiae]MBO1198438.1 ABC transporter permease [Staphylococcus simiae]MBO1200632.1 ABC transporter permease [Staphylococcus simiae]MBO1202903.1 ABC transporter permease [Staphylococcus simiae]MBO1210429.1 ABC transporter permease [Staphylococcus simiae]MBO1228969.1 ABC transporter permease [Staphylococcus simiae]